MKSIVISTIRIGTIDGNKQLKKELAEIQKEEQELDRTIHLPLYSSKATESGSFVLHVGIRRTC